MICVNIDHELLSGLINDPVNVRVRVDLPNRRLSTD